MGKRVNQDGAAFKDRPRSSNGRIRPGTRRCRSRPPSFMDEAAVVLKETGVIRTEPDLGKLFDDAFLG